MKKLPVVMVIGLFLMTGCVGAYKRGVQDNTFYSTYPKVAIKMAPDFEYVDKEKETDYSFLTGSETTTGIHVERYIFADTLTRKYSIIRIAKLTRQYTYWRSDLTGYVSNYLDAGIEEQLGETYQYIVVVQKNDFDECMMTKWVGRVIGGNRNTMLNIFYSEPINLEGHGCENNWQDLSKLSVEQKAFYDKFMENADQNMEFIDIASLDLEE